MKGKYFTVLITTLLLSGCGLVDSWSPGDTEVRSIPLAGAITEIKVKSTFEITFIQSDSAYIEVICGENYQSKINIRVEGSVLILSHNIRNRWLNGYDKVSLLIHLSVLPVINAYSPAKIETQGTFTSEQFNLVDWGDFTECNVSIDVNYLNIQTSGDNFGVFKISGRAKNAEIFPRGSASVDCSALCTETCTLNQKSILDLAIDVTAQLNVTILSSGNVYYTGNPVVSLSREGSGRLIKQ